MLDAFDSLLLARASVRVLVYGAPGIDAYDGSPGDTYLLIGCTQGGPDFKVILAQGAGEPSICKPV